MKRFFSILLVLCIALGLFPTVSIVSAEEPVSAVTIPSQADYDASDALWSDIRATEDRLDGKKATMKQKVSAIIETIEASEQYLEGSLVQTESALTWKTEQGIACYYPLTEEEDRGESIGNPISPDAAEYEHISYATKGAAGGKDVYLIGPYYGVDSNFTDHYPNLAKSIASSTGGSYTLYSKSNATIDNIANAISNGAIVLVDSHGTYDSSARKSYLRLTTSTGITTADYNSGNVYESYDSSHGCYIYMVTGEIIAAHMKKDSPNGFVWYGICSGMRYDTMCVPVMERGVEACLGYSRTVSFGYDRSWVSSLCKALMSGKTLAQAASTMKSEVGKWDHCNESAYDTLSEAVNNAVAFPIITSAQDDYPDDVEGLQDVYSTWTLTACKHTSVQYIPAAPAGCILKGNIAHYYCKGCSLRYSDSACTSRLSESEAMIAATGHQMSGNSCTKCGSSKNTLLHFWSSGAETKFRWMADNFKEGTISRADGSDRGILYSTTDGGDHYVYMKPGTNSVGYTVSSGDIIEIRYRTVGLPTSKVGASGTFELWYTTTDSDSSFSSSMKLTASVTRKENEWQTATFTPPTGVTLKRFMIDVLEESSGYAGTKLEVDYIYLGTSADAPSKRTETNLLFDFKNDDAASKRYVNAIYNDINFDRGFWRGNNATVENLAFNSDTVSFCLRDGAEIGYIQTTDANDDLDALPLSYKPKVGDIVQIRLKFENIQAISGKTPYFRLYYIKNNGTSGVGSSDYTSIANLTSTDMNGSYVTFSASLADNFTSASVINAIRPQIGNITKVSGKTGKVTIDYIYVGAEKDAPEQVDDHTHDFNADGICTICGRTHAHNFGSDYVSVGRNATCTVPGIGVKLCADCGEEVGVTIERLAHSFSNNVCTVCGYANRGQLHHFAANTPSASYTWTTYDGTTSVDTKDSGMLVTKLDTDASDHYLTLTQELNYTVVSGDVIEIKFKSTKARSAASFELRYTTTTATESFANATSITKSVSFSANTWTTVQFTPTVGQTVYRLFLEPFLTDDASFAGQTFYIDYIYVGPANGAPSKAKSTAPIYFDFTNDTVSQHRFVSSTYGYMQTFESDADHWLVNGNRATKSLSGGKLTLTLADSGSPYVQSANASGSNAYTDAPLTYTLDGTDYVQFSAKFDNCVLPNDTLKPYVYLNYMTDKTVEHENPTDKMSLDYGARMYIDPAYLSDGQYHVYTIALSSSLTVGEALKCFRLGFANFAKNGTSTVEIDYIAIGKKSQLPLTDVYTVQFVDNAGAVLQKQTVSKGEFAYCSASTAKSADNTYHYVFNGWNKALGPISADTTITAQYKTEKHNLSNPVVTNATCTSQGYTTYTCSVCGKQTVTDYVTGGHEEVLVNAKEATCSEAGYTGDVVCNRCGITISSGKTIATSGHDYGEAVVAIEPTCTESGVARYTCKNCKNSYSADIPATGHINTVRNETKPTCTQNGRLIVTCNDCGQTVEDRVIATSGHTYSNAVTAATCTTQGYTTHRCTACGYSYVDSYVAPLGHSYQSVVTAPTCASQGYTTHLCYACGDSYVDSYVAVTAHREVYQTLQNGTHRISCANSCGYSKTESCVYVNKVCVCGAVKACDHVETTSVTTLEPTCTTDGSANIVCNACGEIVDTKVLAKTAHQIIYVDATAPTCTEKGWKKHWRCEKCGEFFADENGNYVLPQSYFEIAPTGHNATFVADKEATCTESGHVQHYACNGCGMYFFDLECQYEAPAYFVIIAPLGHNYVNGVCVCGDTEWKAPILNTNLTFNMSVSVGAEMQVMYSVSNAKVKSYQSFYLEVVKEVADGESVKTIFSLENNNLELTKHPTNGTVLGYSATYTGIFASQMGDNFTTTLYAVAADGTVYCSASQTGSIKSALYEKLASGSAELKTLAVDMLNYGAAAQIFFNYDTKNLVNADLTAAQKALGTQTNPAAYDSSSVTGSGCNVVTSVSLQSKVLLYINCTYASKADSNLKFVIKDRSGKVIEEFAPSVINARVCQGVYGNVGAAQMRDLVTIELYDNGVLVSKTLSWSIESYVAQTRASASDAAKLNAVNAMLIYGDSVAVYMKESGQIR